MRLTHVHTSQNKAVQQALQMSLVVRVQCCSNKDNLFSVSELTYPETFQMSLHSNVVCWKTYLLKYIHAVLSHVKC